MRDDSVTVPDPGDILFPVIPVEAIRAYSVGRLWFPQSDVELRPKPDDGMRVRVASVKVDGVWVEL
jgi:hypothetical protein